jgi:hypothetical protein
MNSQTSTSRIRCRATWLGLVLAASSGLAFAQGATQQSYFGLNVGKPKLGTDCGSPAFSCDDASVSGHIYAGKMISQYFGVEAGYFNAGDADRAGGRTKAQGINLSLLGVVPLGPVDIFGKGGANYGRTDVTSALLSGVPAGKANSWGGSYGAGVGWNLGDHSRVVLQWDRHDMKFAGTGREAVEMTSVGYVWRF